MGFYSCWVYPRVGGGTMVAACLISVMKGLSPRGRGNRDNRPVRVQAVGSIPAWAGEPEQVKALSDNGQVYPRVGGGTH